MKINSLMISFLTAHKEARERKNKNRCLAYVVSKIHSPNIKIEVLEDMVSEVLSMDRAWRKALADNPHLRGTDYKEKERLERVAQRGLGYKL